MKSIAFMQKLLWLLILSSCLLSSCQDKMEEHYEKPEWLQGSVWELLESRENYSTFLEAVELAGFRPYLEGKGILTVMAPDDKAFNAYLNEQGYDSVEAMVKGTSVEQLRKLVGFHLLYYSYTKNNLENFRPEGQGVLDGDEEILDAGLYYKFRTRSTSPTTIEHDLVNNKDVTIYHLERFIPVFSYNFFESKQIDAKTNYEYFYPNSTWTGSNGFNVSDATVEEYELIANNGYVYTIDRVLEPLETIYEELKKNSEYTDFLAIYNNYSYYEYDENVSSNYGETLGVDSLYLHKHNDPLPPIALEWPVSNYQRLDTLAYKSYSVFAPTNKALSEFYNNYFSGGGYESITSVDPLILSTLLGEYVYGGSVVFPEEITSGKIVSSFGTTYNFDPYTNAKDAKMCVNGSFYGLDEIDGPSVFTSVAGPAFKDPQYINFLYALSGAGWLNLFGSQTYEFTLLIPDNATFQASNFQLSEYVTGNVLEVIGGEGETITRDQCTNIILTHTVMEGAIALPTSGTRIIENAVPNNYWFVKDGKITTSNTFNSVLGTQFNINDIFVDFTELTYNGKNWNNGKTYTYSARNGLLGFETVSTLLHQTLSGSNNWQLPYFAFGQLLKKADLILNSQIQGLAEQRFIAFIPTNDAIDQALRAGRIPGAENAYVDYDGETLGGDFDTEILAEYILNYFIPAGSITAVPYIGSALANGAYENYAGNYLTYTDTGSALSVRMQGGTTTANVIPDYYYFPFAYDDGCFHFIDSILE